MRHRSEATVLNEIGKQQELLRFTGYNYLVFSYNRMRRVDEFPTRAIEAANKRSQQGLQRTSKECGNFDIIWQVEQTWML